MEAWAGGFIHAAVRNTQGSLSGKQLIGGLLSHMLPDAPIQLLRKMTGRSPYWLNQKWFDERGASNHLLKPRPTDELLRAELHRAFTQTSLPMLLRYEDRNSMAFSIESRVPFLTPSLVQFSFSLPEEYLIGSDGVTKTILRKSMRGIVPDQILDRRDKIGFATPELVWLRHLQPWAEQVLGGETARSLNFWNIDVLQKDFSAVLSGKKYFDFRIWRWINLVRWIEMYQVKF